MWWRREGRPASPVNYNVKLALWWSLLEFCSASVRSGDILSALLFLLTSSNSTVGVIQGINGVMQMVAALPAGWLADRHRRDSILRAGAAVGAVAGGVLAYALVARPTVACLGAASALLGCYRGVYNAALEALFADSVPPGRSSPYSRKYAITVLAFSFGPWLSLFLFHRLGNQWRVDDCRAVLLSGVALMAAPLALMCFFDDDRAVQHRGAAHPGQQQGTRQGTEQQEPCCGDGGSGEGDSSEPQAAAAAAPGAAPAAGGGGGPGVAAATAADPAAGDAVGWLEEGEAEDAPPPCCGLPAAVAVTLLITASDLIGALASGMTLKFFSMFFFQQVGFSPMAVSLIGAAAPLGVAAASLACQRLSKPAGRVQVSLVTRGLDIGLLVALAYLPTAPASAHLPLVAVHLTRMAVANATQPLMRSVLMDFVPRRHRGKVNAIDGVRSFSWSGSAALGGYLIERCGFQTTFLITAAIKTAAFLPLFLLLRFVPDGVGVPAGARAARLAALPRWEAPAAKPAAAAAAAEDDDGGLREPLLAAGGR